jgi:hypothetical protein
MTDSRLQQTLQKIEKVLRLSDGECVHLFGVEIPSFYEIPAVTTLRT